MFACVAFAVVWWCSRSAAHRSAPHLPALVRCNTCSRPLEEGDIVSIDVSCFVDGHHGDNCRTFYVGDVSEETRELVEVTREATNDAVALCGPGVPYNEVGHCIQAICDKHGYAIVRNYTGHGVGAVFHTQPWVLHYASPDYGKMEAGSARAVVMLRLCLGLPRVTQGESWACVTAGTTFTIEPMICAGSNSVRGGGGVWLR